MSIVKWSTRWRLAATALGVASLVSGCNGTNNPIPPPESVVNRATLTSFQGGSACADLEQYLEDTAVLQMRTQLEAARDGVPGWGWWGGWGWGPILAGAEDNAAPAQPRGPTDYTTTNNQVAGVDEADFIKNDGTRIFALAGNTLHAVKSWPAEQTALQGTLKLEGYPAEMFLDGDKVVVFSNVYNWYPLSGAQGVACDSLDCGYYSANTVKVTEVDASNLAALRVTRETYLPGSYSSARKIDHSVRLVLSDDFNMPPGVKWGPDWSQDLWNDQAKLRAAYDRVIADNEVLIRQQTLADWVPAAKVKFNGQTTVLPHACEAFSKVNAPTRLGQVSVVTLDLAQGSLDRSTILAEPGQIYASQDNLYVATQHWWWWPAPGQRDTTYVHKFDISQPDKARYVASGTVDGHIVDQFSLDEGADGALRVVTSITTRVTDPSNPDNWWGTTQTTNRVSVLGENLGYLDVIGQTPDFAGGETVQSARILGDKGFVVTYQQVDPLFTFDLSDSRHPVKVGELTVPGFSTYLHPLDASHLLTIGIYTPADTTNWQERRLQLAIYDVSNLAHPVQTHTQLVGTAYGWSEAAYEHKAFNYFAAKKLLAIPFADYGWGVTGGDYWSTFKSDLRVFSVDALAGFTPRGAVDMGDLYTVYQYENWTYYWEPYVRRSVMADDYVYAVSDSGLRVANVADLSQPLSTVRFAKYEY